jgi:hypothetical protein
MEDKMARDENGGMQETKADLIAVLSPHMTELGIRELA